jgi:alpha-L-rhamnosidase
MLRILLAPVFTVMLTAMSAGAEDRGGPAAWSAAWIAMDRPPVTAWEDFFRERPAPLFRREFTLEKEIAEARAYVTGLGCYELRINGEKIGDHELDPAWTAYENRIFYSAFDVTRHLRKGANAAGMIAGSGWYDPLPLKMWNRFNLREFLPVGEPCVLLQLEVTYEDGAREIIRTGASWKTAASPILKNSVYLGEVYDFRKEQPGWDKPGFNDSAWAAAVPAAPPPGRLEKQPLPPIRVTQTIHPVRLTEQAPGVWIYDLGENIAGRVRFRCRGPEGARIQLRYGELLYPDGSLNPMTAVCGQIKNRDRAKGSEAPSTAWQRDVVFLDGREQAWYGPRFTFHGFRYVEVTGCSEAPALEDMEGQRLHTDVRPVGEFACSNERFNTIQEISVRTLRGNLHGVQSDCPHREKFGYGGDLVADSGLGLYNFDMAAFYRKVVHDFADEVRPNGGFTETAPYVGIGDHGLGEGAGPIGWGTAHPLLAWQLYTWYGDENLMRREYPAAKKWLALLEDKADAFLLENGIGDHESLVPKHTDVTGTGFFAMNASLLAKMARSLGENDDARRFEALAENIRTAFTDTFFDPETGKIGAGTQCNQAFALYLDLVPESARAKVLEALAADIEAHDRHLTTGIFGTPFMLHALCDEGRADLAYAIVNQRDFPGWGHMIENGATTLWEHWEFSDNTFSHNHPMFGSVSEWFFARLAGIRPASGARGFDRIRIRPEITGDLTWVRARLETIRGTVSAAWKIENDTLTLEVTIPPDTAAEIHIPVRDDAVNAPDGAEAAGEEKGFAQYTVSGGTYQFETGWK